jgi:hypothetical protein
VQLGGVNAPVRDTKVMSTGLDVAAEQAIGCPKTIVLPLHANTSSGADAIPLTTVDAPLENPFGP